MSISDYTWQSFWKSLTDSWPEWTYNAEQQKDWRATLTDCDDTDLLWKAKTKHYAKRSRYKTPDLDGLLTCYRELAHNANLQQAAAQCRLYWICTDSPVQERIGMIREISYPFIPSQDQIDRWLEGLSKKRGYEGRWICQMGTDDYHKDWIAAHRKGHDAKHAAGLLNAQDCKFCMIDDLLGQYPDINGLASPQFKAAVTAVTGVNLDVPDMTLHIGNWLNTPTKDGLRRNTPATVRKTNDLREGQMLALTANVLTERKAALEAAKQPQKEHDPNQLMEDDELPF